MRVSLRRRERGLWLWWVLATALGELLGFAVPASLGAVASRAMAGMSGVSVDVAFAGIMVVAGVGEGSVLGFAQWLVLRRYIQQMTRREWVLATGIAAGVAWIIGMLPSTLGDIITVDPMVLVGGTVEEVDHLRLAEWAGIGQTEHIEERGVSGDLIRRDYQPAPSVGPEDEVVGLSAG